METAKKQSPSQSLNASDLLLILVAASQQAIEQVLAAREEFSAAHTEWLAGGDTAAARALLDDAKAVLAAATAHVRECLRRENEASQAVNSKPKRPYVVTGHWGDEHARFATFEEVLAWVKGTTLRGLSLCNEDRAEWSSDCGAFNGLTSEEEDAWAEVS